MKGAFITFEGCEGVGKSTQVKLLKEYLEKTGQEAVFTREPGGTEVAERIRSVILDPSSNISPLVEAYLFASARADHVEKVIKPALEEGKIVVCDRFLDSSLAYQGSARGLGVGKVLSINALAVGECVPDCIVFLDLAPEKSFRRRKGVVVEGDRMEAESLAFHNRVYSGFCNRKNDPRYICIVPQEDRAETSRMIIAALKERGFIA